MKRLLICLLVMVAVFVFSSSIAVADCPDSRYACKRTDNGSWVGTVRFGNCYKFPASCKICGGSYAKVARECNSKFPRCEGKCVACKINAEWQQTRDCWNSNGNKVGYPD